MAALALRPYQEKSLTMLYDWLANNEGHVVTSLPTGAGKSVVIAELCRRALSEWPETRILMLTRSMELIQQNADKLKSIWPAAPVGIYSASVGKKTLGEPITIGGPLSIVRVLEQIGSIDLLVIDECHDISHKDEGTYRKIIAHLQVINPSMRVIGYTASPYRLGHGLITDKPAIFDGMIEPVSIQELVDMGYLSKLRSKFTHTQINSDGVKKRGGEFIESDLQRVVDTSDNNVAVVEEVIQRGADRKSWMFFCTGVAHAKHINDLLIERGIQSVCVTGELSKIERDKAVSDFKTGRVRAVTQVSCLSVGFDHPELDLIAMVRPTMSPGYYLQCAGRGLRVAPGKADCLFLDFVGVVETHGPITSINPPKRKGDGEGEAPIKVCDACHEICHASVKACTACGAPFPEPVKAPLELRTNDIMGQGDDLMVENWSWRKHTSRASGKEMLAVTYYGALSDKPVSEYICVTHDGYAGTKARALLATLARQSGAPLDYGSADLDDMAAQMMQGKPPQVVTYKKEGKFFNVTARTYTE